MIYDVTLFLKSPAIPRTYQVGGDDKEDAEQQAVTRWFYESDEHHFSDIESVTVTRVCETAGAR